MMLMGCAPSITRSRSCKASLPPEARSKMEADGVTDVRLSTAATSSLSCLQADVVVSDAVAPGTSYVLFTQVTSVEVRGATGAVLGAPLAPDDDADDIVDVVMLMQRIGPFEPDAPPPIPPDRSVLSALDGSFQFRLKVHGVTDVRLAGLRKDGGRTHSYVGELHVARYATLARRFWCAHVTHVRIDDGATVIGFCVAGAPDEARRKLRMVLWGFANRTAPTWDPNAPLV